METDPISHGFVSAGIGAPQNGPRYKSKDALERNQPNRLLMDDSYQHVVGNGWKWWVAQTSSFMMF